MAIAKSATQQIGKGVRLLRYVASTAFFDVRANILGQRFPLKPTTLNLLVNDICNSRCQMCLIWKQKREFEISPDELAVILEDPLFDKLQSIGVSGGEPTLRVDLPDIYRVITKKKKPIKSAGIITNAINPDQVLDRILASAEICREGNIEFHVMVSLDGIGGIHDKVRGRDGNFDSALRVIRHLQNATEIPVIFGCTITKDNLWYVDDLLDFAIREKLYGRFRIAEYIKRLYNQDQTEYIRNFSDLEAYHLGLFFSRLEKEFETRPIFKRTYRNVRAMLLDGAKRSIGCPYQTNAVVIDSRGQMLYCSPKSPNLGSTLQFPSQQLYLQNIPVRKNTIAKDCDNCIHDYHAQPKINELVAQGAVKLNQQLLSITVGTAKKRLMPKIKSSTPLDELTLNSALILGWYGTETAGDKAILAEIIYRMKQRGVQEITVASLNPYITKWTIKELGYPEIKIIDTYRDDLLSAASNADITIMGGGPLMEIRSLGAILNAFIRSQMSGKYTYIAGCGIGPLENPSYTRGVIDLLHSSDWIELRDTYSANWAIQQTGRSDIVNSGDPAQAYVLRWKENQQPLERKSAYLNCYLRAWSPEYRGEYSKDEFETIQEAFELQLGNWITSICNTYNLKPRLLAMHHFTIGGDDRIYNRQLALKRLAHLDPIVQMEPYSLNQILESMRDSAYNFTMRFHSMLFAHSLGVPFTVIDYTQGGKIKHYLTDNQALDHYIGLEQVARKQWQSHRLMGLTE